MLQKRDVTIENLQFHSENCINELIRFDRIVDHRNEQLQIKISDIHELHELNSKLNNEIRTLIDEKQKIYTDNLRKQKHLQELLNLTQNLNSQINILKGKEE